MQEHRMGIQLLESVPYKRVKPEASLISWPYISLFLLPWFVYPSACREVLGKLKHFCKEAMSILFSVFLIDTSTKYELEEESLELWHKDS